MHLCVLIYFFFFNDTATTEIYTLSLHDALPISAEIGSLGAGAREARAGGGGQEAHPLLGRDLRPHHLRRRGDRKSTRLNSSHANISYAVFCLKKKKNKYDSQDLSLSTSLTSAAK